MPIYKCPMCHKIHPNKTKVGECCVEVPVFEFERAVEIKKPAVSEAAPPFPKSEEEVSSKGPFPIYEEDEDIFEDVDEEGKYV